MNNTNFKTLKTTIILVLLLVCNYAVAQTYPLSDEALAAKIAAKEQITDVPTIYITIPDVGTDGIATDYELNDQLKKNDDDTDYHDATIQVVDLSGTLENFTDNGLQIKVRGNSTALPGGGKRPYRLKFAKDKKDEAGNVIETHKHDLLGSGYKKRNWTLLANTFDPTMMRNAITYHIGKYIGMPFCPGYKFVDLVINGNYRGTYQVSDQVEVGSHRIDIDEDTDWYLEYVNWSNMAEEPYVGDGTMTVCIKNPEYSATKEAEQLAQLKDDVKTWSTAWENAFQSSSKSSGWQAYNDVESMVRFYVGINLTGDYDGWFVFKGYRTPTGPFFWGPLWDKDLAYDNCQWLPANGNEMLVEEYNKSNLDGNIQKLWTDHIFIPLVKDKIDALVTDGVYEKLSADIDNIQETLKNTQKQNYKKWNILDSNSGKTRTSTDYSQYVEELDTYIKNRVEWLQGKINTLYENLPEPTASTYNTENYWWSTGQTLNTIQNVTMVNRSFTTGEWNTFCLPFDASQEQMEEALGCQYELKVHSGMDSDETTMLFTTPETLDVTGGIPYLLKPLTQVNATICFNGVIPSENVNNNGTYAYNGKLVTFDNKHFFGASLYHGYELSTSTDYIFNNDIYADNTSLTKTTKDNQSGCRAYLRVPEGETPAISFTAKEDVSCVFDANNSTDDYSDYVVGGKQWDVTINNRTFNNAYWNSLSLPFDVSMEKVKEVFGDGTEVVEFGTFANNQMTFTTVTGNLVAGNPYFIKPANTVVNPVFNGVEITMVDGGNSVAIGSVGSFTANLRPVTLKTDGTELYLSTTGRLSKPSASTRNFSGTRAFFTVNDANMAKQISIVMDGETSSISSIETEETQFSIYNLNGQRMEGKLPKGIYIANGKKIIIK